MARTQRRYRPGEKPDYDANFDMRKATSPIHFPKNATVENAWVAAELADARGLDDLLAIHRGDENGTYRDQGRKKNSALKEAQLLLAKVESDFAHQQGTATNHGRRPPEQMPPELERRRLIAEANLDVVMSEVEKLEDLRAKAAEKQTVSDAGEVLRNGPRGVVKMRDGIASTVDGQKVRRSATGMFVIDDPRSRYNGLLVHRYLSEVCRMWVLGNGALRAGLRAKVDRGEMNGADMPISPQVPWPDPPTSTKGDKNG